MTSRGRHPFLDWPGPIPFAHRGGASIAPENTLAAFRHAVDLGYRYLETDVHATADGVLVAFHDVDLSRTCGRPGLIGEMSWSDVARARVDDREPIPLLEDLLEEFGEARINIDCKSDAAVEPLIATVRRTGCIDRICIGAFSDRRLRRLRGALGEGLCTALGPLEVAGLRLLGRRPHTPTAAQVPVRQGPIEIVTEGFIERSRRHGIDVHVWTIDDPDEMSRLLDLGVGGIMTDRPDLLREVLESRRQWAT